jgi:hypothetical protein
MKTPKNLSDLELHFAGMDIDESDLVGGPGEPENLRYQVSAKPMSEAKAELLLELLDVPPIPDHILDLEEEQIPWREHDLYEMYARAVYGDANAIHLMFWALLVNMHKTRDLSGKYIKMNSKQLDHWHKTHIAQTEGGNNRAKQLAEKAISINTWLYPLLAKCDATISPERKHRGWKTIQRLAKRELGIDHPHLKSVTEYRIQTWINKGRPAKAPETPL